LSITENNSYSGNRVFRKADNCSVIVFFGNSTIYRHHAVAGENDSPTHTVGFTRENCTHSVGNGEHCSDNWKSVFFCLSNNNLPGANNVAVRFITMNIDHKSRGGRRQLNGITPAPRGGIQGVDEQLFKYSRLVNLSGASNIVIRSMTINIGCESRGGRMELGGTTPAGTTPAPGGGIQEVDEQLFKHSRLVVAVQALLLNIRHSVIHYGIADQYSQLKVKLSQSNVEQEDSHNMDVWSQGVLQTLAIVHQYGYGSKCYLANMLACQHG
jgi:hypothetical protein